MTIERHRITESRAFAQYRLAREGFLAAPTQANRTKVRIAARRYMFSAGMAPEDVKHSVEKIDADMARMIADMGELEHTATAAACLGDALAKIGE